jgi:hypothetical protein
MDSILTRPGGFVVGCNYWASHAGTNTWSNWQPQVIMDDLRQLAEGQEIRPSVGNSAGMVVLYILAALFALQILFVLAAMLIGVFIR